MPAATTTDTLTETLTDEMVSELQSEAIDAGDLEMALICERALFGSQDAKDRCASALNNARGMDDDADFARVVVEPLPVWLDASSIPSDAAVVWEMSNDDYSQDVHYTTDPEALMADICASTGWALPPMREQSDRWEDSETGAVLFSRWARPVDDE